MPRKKEHLFDFLDRPSYEILLALKSGSKGFNEIQKVSSLSVSNFNTRIDWLLELGLVKETLGGGKRKRKVYALTDTGKRILELLEEIERVYKEGVMKEKEGREVVFR
ncbi:hypothetical protein DRP04_13825 [Archaeoglobales archaeon]|nr:MAG: hypothetical protein DRP04_13825 [Archaeoglobales archaeon]